MRCWLVLVLFVSVQANAGSDYLAFLESPGEITKNIFEQKKRSMEEIFDGYIIEYGAEEFLFDPAERPGSSEGKTQCQSPDGQLYDFTARYKSEVVGNKRVDTVLYMCDTSVTADFEIKLERPFGRLELTPKEFMSLKWTEKMEAEKIFRISIQWVNSGKFYLDRKAEQEKDVFTIFANYGNETFHYRIEDTEYFYLRYNGAEMAEFEATEIPTAPDSFPRLFLYDHLNGREISKSEMRDLYQGWFSGVFAFFVGSSLF